MIRKSSYSIMFAFVLFFNANVFAGFLNDPWGWFTDKVSSAFNTALDCGLFGKEPIIATIFKEINMKKLISSIALIAALNTVIIAQTSYSVSLQVSRGGESISLLAKRASISVQDLESGDVSAWFGKSRSIALEELNYLASQKVGEGYELLGVI